MGFSAVFGIDSSPRKRRTADTDASAVGGVALTTPMSETVSDS